MATSNENLEGTTPITPEERVTLQETISNALDGFAVEVVGEPNREGDSAYAIAIIKKMEG